ncbi:MAG: DUF1446 domain-containing protein [Ardenticatenaceae bacterium]|nr:DUF1446 domain-containing protein [Ardenticatenaceae bacterium]
MTARELRVLAPTGNLGHSPIQEASYREGLRRDPHYVVADAGSADIGPSFLGADVAHNPIEWDRMDLELLLTTTRERQIPLIIGSAGGTGTNRGVDLFLALIREIAAERRLAPFRLATIYADVDPDALRERVRRGEDIPGLGSADPLTLEDVDRTDHVVAMMGVEPIIRALELGADVVVAGRACDDAIFAALPIWQGYPRALALHMGKALECASLVAEPEMVKETILGTLSEDRVLVEPMHPEQRCTPRSVAAHSMYERVDPYTQAIPSGVLDTREARYEAVTDRICQITGSRFIPDPVYRVKLEGAGRVGYRAFSIVGLRDPNAIQNLDRILADVRERVERVYPALRSDEGYQLVYHIYGRNGVMGALEPVKEVRSHELGVVSEIIAPSQKLALDIAKLVQYRFLFGRYPGQKHSGGGAALIIDESLRPEHPAYRWTIDHLLTLKDPLALFPIELHTIGG